MEHWFRKEHIIICTRFWRDLRDIGVEKPVGELLLRLFGVDGRTAWEWGERGWNERRWTIERSLILETELGWIRAKWFIGELFIFGIKRYIYRSSQLDLVSPDWRFNYGLTNSGPTLQHFTCNFCFFSRFILFYSIEFILRLQMVFQYFSISSIFSFVTIYSSRFYNFMVFEEIELLLYSGVINHFLSNYTCIKYFFFFYIFHYLCASDNAFSLRYYDR